MMTYANGDVYVGEFEEGKYDGIGKLIKADGSIQEGTWSKGILTKSRPQEPANVTVKQISEDRFELNWTAPAGINYTRLYYTLDPREHWMEVLYPDLTQIKLRGNRYIFTGAEPNQDYYFMMRSVASEVESKDSLIVSASTAEQGAAPTHHVIQSTIQYKFDGYANEKTFTLSNGQVWKQTSYQSRTAKRFMPEVLIFLNENEYKMMVDGYDELISVTRIK